MIMATDIKLRAAIIGCGQIAGGYDEESDEKRVQTHAKAYQLQPATELAAVCDFDIQKVEKFRLHWGRPAVYSNVALMLSEEKPDIVSICTPDDTHAEILELCLDYPSIKAVWCEKPLATKVDRAERIVPAYAEKGIMLVVNYQRRWDAQMQRIKNALQHHELGEIQKVVVYYTKGICHNGSHVVDLLLDWFGQPDEMQALGSHVDFNTDDPTVDARIMFGNAAVYMLGVDAREYSIFEMHILGTSGRVNIRDNGLKIEWFQRQPSSHFKGYQELIEQKANTIPYNSQPMVEALQEIIRAISSNSKIRSNGESALATLRVCCELVNQAKAIHK